MKRCFLLATLIKAAAGLACGAMAVPAIGSGGKPFLASGAASSAGMKAAAASPSRLSNISTRGQVLTGDEVMIGGFVIGGSSPKKVLITARGPSLATFGITNPLANPKIELYAGQTVIATNDNWQQQADPSDVTAIQALGIFPNGLAPSDPNEAALLVTLNPGAYTAVVSGVGNGTGVGIVEVFEQGNTDVPLLNISTRGQVQTGNNVMIGGFVISGADPKKVLVTARGPSLTAFGIPKPLADPRLEIYSGQTKIFENDNWQVQSESAGGSAAVAAISAMGTFPNGLAPSAPKEAAILISLAPGPYTAVVSGSDGGSGVGIVEVFEMADPQLSVTRIGTGSGSVTSSPAGIDCGASCSAAFSRNATVSLAALPAANSDFVAWGGACTGSGTCAVLLDGSKTVTATFSLRAPAVTLALKSQRVRVGGTTELSWSSTNASSCAAGGGWSGGQPLNGTVTVTATAGGRVLYTITCTGPGGSATASATLITPMPVLGTSYENKNLIPFDATQVPTVRALGIPKTVPGEQDSIDRSIAFGDFFGEGRYSAYVMASNSDGAYGPNLPGDVPGVGYFLDRDASGKWIDRSVELFKAASDRPGCISPSYSAVADFNNDGRPDVYVACTGIDFIIPGATPEQNQAAGRSPGILVLSGSDGTYRSISVESANPMYGHKAIAVDINGDGNVDVVTTDVTDPAQPIGCGAPYVLLGKGDGTFSRDYGFIDQNKLRQAFPLCGMFNVDIVPVQGRYDLLVGGLVSNGSSPGTGSWAVYRVTGRPTGGGFDFSQGSYFPMPFDSVSNSTFQFPLDVVFDPVKGLFYFKTTGTLFDLGTSWAILEFDSSGQFTRAIDRWLNLTSDFKPASPQFKPSYLNAGTFKAYTGGCAADLSRGECGRDVTIP